MALLLPWLLVDGPLQTKTESAPYLRLILHAHVAPNELHSSKIEALIEDLRKPTETNGNLLLDQPGSLKCPSEVLPPWHHFMMPAAQKHTPPISLRHEQSPLDLLSLPAPVISSSEIQLLPEPCGFHKGWLQSTCQAGLRIFNLFLYTSWVKCYTIQTHPESKTPFLKL